MKDMAYDEFADARASQNLRLIDVREQNEYDEVHVHGAELFALSKLRQGQRPDAGDQPVAVICRSGGRSAIACQILEKDGWDECINVDGGTLAAIDAGEDHVERG